MGINTNEVFVGAPSQSTTTGAVQTAAIGTAAPTDARAALSATDWTGSGYVDENGVTLSQSRSTTGIKDWGGSTVRTLLDDYEGTVKYTEMETSYEAMCRMVGASNVTKTDATADHGVQLKVAFGPELPEARAWVFSMKDGNRRMRIYIPNGQITEVDDASFVRNDAVKWAFTIKANDDGTGHSIYLFTDDGVVASA